MCDILYLYIQVNDPLALKLLYSDVIPITCAKK